MLHSSLSGAGDTKNVCVCLGVCTKILNPILYAVLWNSSQPLLPGFLRAGTVFNTHPSEACVERLVFELLGSGKKVDS